MLSASNNSQTSDACRLAPKTLAAIEGLTRVEPCSLQSALLASAAFRQIARTPRV